MKRRNGKRSIFSDSIELCWDRRVLKSSLTTKQMRRTRNRLISIWCRTLYKMAWIKSIKESKLYTKEEIDQIERINKIYFLLLEQERVKWQADLKENLLKIPQGQPAAKHLVKPVSRKQKKFNEQLEIAREVDLESVVEQYVDLRRSGEYRMVGLCPFHSEKTPSFFVYTNDNHFYCFGCQEFGDVIKFIRLVENLTFKQAVNTLYRFSQES